MKCNRVNYSLCFSLSDSHSLFLLLRTVQKDKSLFASKEDQVSQLNVQIKDALTAIDAHHDKHQKDFQRMSKKTTGAHRRAVQEGIATLNSRLQGIAVDF